MLPFDWVRDYNLRIRNGRVVGGPAVRKRCINVPVSRPTLQGWLDEFAAARSEPAYLPLPTATTITDASDPEPRFLTLATVPADSYRTWRARAEISTGVLRFRVFTSTDETVHTEPVDSWMLVWLRLYWSGAPDEPDQFRAMLEVAPHTALDVLETGFALVGQPATARRRLADPAPTYLAPALQHSDREVRERALSLLAAARARQSRTF